ncbi:unnamed protein product [Gongylonema pulchrum]|uniref:Secreted protein n=1 Tax=Gongylonema pulchrum TaxID=637853 RepID=A0A183EAW5_9BILA|nr:unnamed protein product [Gongylonema pulchrum]
MLVDCCASSVISLLLPVDSKLLPRLASSSQTLPSLPEQLTSSPASEVIVVGAECSSDFTPFSVERLKDP